LYDGYTLYELTAAASRYELPLFVTLAQARRHDSVLGVVALAQFKELFPCLANRSAAERSFKRTKVDYELGRCRVRSKEAWFWRSHLVAMNQHLDAWIAEASAHGWDIWAEVLGQPLAA